MYTKVTHRTTKREQSKNEPVAEEERRGGKEHGVQITMCDVEMERRSISTTQFTSAF